MKYELPPGVRFSHVAIFVAAIALGVAMGIALAPQLRIVVFGGGLLAILAATGFAILRMWRRFRAATVLVAGIAAYFLVVAPTLVHIEATRRHRFEEQGRAREEAALQRHRDRITRQAVIASKMREQGYPLDSIADRLRVFGLPNADTVDLGTPALTLWRRKLAEGMTAKAAFEFVLVRRGECVPEDTVAAYLATLPRGQQWKHTLSPAMLPLNYCGWESAMTEFERFLRDVNRQR